MPIDATATYLDLRGLKCPLPVLLTRKLLDRLGHGDLAIIECTDPLSMIDIPHLVRLRGDALELNRERDGVYVFHIRRQGEEPASDRVKTLAAIVFEKSEQINGLMAEFAAALADQGRRLAGFIQVDAHMPDCNCPETHVRDLESGARIPILQNLGAHAQGCRADGAALADVAVRVHAALARRPDLLIINRFGRLESEGKGLRAEIAAAALSGIPVLVGVATRHLAAWRIFAQGLDEELACCRAALDDWWQRLEKAGPSLRVSLEP